MMGEKMETLERMIDALAKEISRNIKVMSKIKNIGEKKTQAEIIKLMCESLGVFFTALAAVQSEHNYEYDDDFYEADHYDEDDEYFDDDENEQVEADMKKFTPLHKKKKGKKIDKDDIPF
jgi:hypothetical protein